MAESMRVEPRPKYISIALTSFQQAVSYRMTTLTNIALTFIWVFILYYLWKAAFSERQMIQGFTWDDMRTYVVIAYGLNALIGWRISANMMQTIRTGDILRDLTRPLNYCTNQLSMATGAAMVEGVLSLGLTLVVGLVFIGMRPPESPLAAVLFAIAVVLGFLIKALVVFCVSLLTFWTLNGVGISWSREAVINILSGTIIPLAMLPGWLQVIADISPMRGIVSTPLMIYLG
ncbi:MAG: ABC transporter permease, partial [Thermomicrobiales bacterium]